MTAPKKPQDRQPKAAPATEAPGFEFDHNGETFVLASADTITAGFARKNRRLSPDDQLYTLLEELADEDALAAIDSMRKPEFEKFQRAFFAHSGIELGE